MNNVLRICIIVYIFLVSSSGFNAQNLTKTNFTGVLTPQFIGAGDGTRTPVVFRATVSGLTSNTVYRYYNQAAISSDLGTTNPGAGNPMLVNNTAGTFKYTTSPGFTNILNYETFTTNASGSYTGWFAFINTGNARFTAGNYVMPTIVLATATTVLHRFALNDSIKVMQFSTSAGANNCTGIYGISDAVPENIVALYDNTSGTGRPLAVSYIQNISSTGVSVSSIAPFYTDSVTSRDGRWGTVIPNNNANGVRRIEQFSLTTGSSVNFNTDSDGDWPSDNTVNPLGGAATLLAVRIDENSAPLPVEIAYFNHTVLKNAVTLKWETVWELNNSGFAVERSIDNNEWKQVAFIQGKGTTSTPVSYEYTDKALLSGKYNYRIKQVDYNGSHEYFSLQQDIIIGSAKEFSLQQNYPNPFNPVTKISYSLSTDAFVKLEIFDVTGRVVLNAVNEKQSAGYRSFDFNASNFASGIYFYRLTAFGENNEMYINKIMKMTIIK